MKHNSQWLLWISLVFVCCVVTLICLAQPVPTGTITLLRKELSYGKLRLDFQKTTGKRSEIWREIYGAVDGKIVLENVLRAPWPVE